MTRASSMGAPLVVVLTLAVALAGCDDGAPAPCTDVACAAECESSGYTRGECTGDACQCHQEWRCAVDSAAVTPRCGGGDASRCEPGETIRVEVSYSGVCPSPVEVEVALEGDDEECRMTASSGQRRGPVVSCAASPCVADWELACAPLRCLGRTATARSVSLWAGAAGAGAPIATAAGEYGTVSFVAAGDSLEVGGDGYLRVGGCSVFPVSMYNICNAHFEGHCDVAACDPSSSSEFLFSNNGDYIDSFMLWGHGDKYEAAGNLFTLMAREIAEIPDAIVEHPNLFGYYQFSESDSPGELEEAYEAVHARDPRHLVIMNHWQQVSTWLPYGDVVSFYVYPVQEVEHFTREEAMYAYEHYAWYDFLEEVAPSDVPKPVWAVIQANGLPLVEAERTIQVPEPAEARAMTYTAITMDVRGLSYWSYLGWGGTEEPSEEFPYCTSGLYNDPELHAYYRQLAAEIDSLNDYLVLPTTDLSWQYVAGDAQVTFSEDPTEAALWETRQVFNYLLKTLPGGGRLLIVVNKAHASFADLTMTVEGLTGAMTATTLGLETTGSAAVGRALAVTDGSFTDSFDGLAAHVYLIQ